MFALYRAGKTHTVDGVQCEVIRVTLDQLQEHRADGWVDFVEDIYPEQKEVKEPVKVAHNLHKK